MVKKVKDKKKISKNTNYSSFNPIYLKFNFSFITYDKNFTEKHQVQFLQRMRELSEVPYMEVASWNRKIGFEIEQININLSIHSAFFDSNTHRNFDDKKFAIFRLYTNDNPILARVIGKIINKIFYVFFIDIGGNLYNH